MDENLLKYIKNYKSDVTSCIGLGIPKDVDINKFRDMLSTEIEDLTNKGINENNAQIIDSLTTIRHILDHFYLQGSFNKFIDEYDQKKVFRINILLLADGVEFYTLIKDIDLDVNIYWADKDFETILRTVKLME